MDVFFWSPKDLMLSCSLMVRIKAGALPLSRRPLICNWLSQPLMAARLDHREKTSSKHLPSSVTKKDIHAHKHVNFKELKC
jgi:hypothetical protein